MLEVISPVCHRKCLLCEIITYTDLSLNVIVVCLIDLRDQYWYQYITLHFQLARTAISDPITALTKMLKINLTK